MKENLKIFLLVIILILLSSFFYFFTKRIGQIEAQQKVINEKIELLDKRSAINEKYMQKMISAVNGTNTQVNQLPAGQGNIQLEPDDEKTPEDKEDEESVKEIRRMSIDFFKKILKKVENEMDKEDARDNKKEKQQ